MIQESRDASFYDVLDVRKNATPEAIREAYVRAKNAFANDSLATYSLFDKSQSKKMLEEIESAYNILSDPEKRRRYDQAHGYIMSIESLRNMPNVIIENGEEVSEVGMPEKAQAAPTNASAGNESALEQLLFNGNAATTKAAYVPAATPVSSAPAQNDFAERYVAANAKAISRNMEEPSSKNFIPNASMNPNAHYIHKRHEMSPELEDRLKQAEAVDGSFLRQAREYRGVSIEEMMEFTKLTRKYLEALEQDSVEKLPAPVYVRGFVMQYAKALQLDATRVTASYMRNYQSLREARGMR